MFKGLVYFNFKKSIISNSSSKINVHRDPVDGSLAALHYMQLLHPLRQVESSFIIVTKSASLLPHSTRLLYSAIEFKFFISYSAIYFITLISLFCSISFITFTVINIFIYILYPHIRYPPLPKLKKYFQIVCSDFHSHLPLQTKKCL